MILKTKIKLVIWICITILVSAFCVIMMIGGAKVNNDDYIVAGFFVMFLSIPLFIAAIVSTIKNKEMDKIKKEKIQISKLEKTVRIMIKELPDLDFAEWGKFDKNKIQIDPLIDYVKTITDNFERQVELVFKLFNKRYMLIQKHVRYLINYFVYSGIGYFEDVHFWKNYNTNPKIYTDEKCFEILNKEKLYGKDFNLYLKKDTTKSIVEYLNNKIPFFDAEKYVKEIKIEYIYFNEETFSIQISDKYLDCLCGAYEEFNDDLEGLDFHNF